MYTHKEHKAWSVPNSDYMRALEPSHIVSQDTVYFLEHASLHNLWNGSYFHFFRGETPSPFKCLSYTWSEQLQTLFYFSSSLPDL